MKAMGKWTNGAGVAAICMLLSMRLVAQVDHPTNLMPMPKAVAFASGQFALTPQFAINVTSYDDVRLDASVLRAIEGLRVKTGLELVRTVRRGSGGLTVAVDGAGEAVQGVGEDESYSLEVSANGAMLRAKTVVGALRGLETVQQLVEPAGDHYALPFVSITDSPRFPWRGLMLDCGRHFEPVPAIKRTLDGMAAVKLNVFHWHLTEDQGFRIESKLYPKLTAMGSDGLYYTQVQAAEVVAYARSLGIRVVPEFEMPGHSTAWLVAYPELASARAPKGIRREFGVSDYALDPTREETYEFVRRFLGEMTTIFPDAYVHIGGDETVSPEWKSDPRITAFMQQHGLKDPDALQAYFNQRVLKILTALHKHMVGWDEILNPALSKDVVIQSWRGEESLQKAAQQGYQGILSAGYYLDGMRSAEAHYAIDPLPEDAKLNEAQRKLVLGGEICMWAEQIDERSVDSRLWPRSAVIAERFWSQANVTDVMDMNRRMRATSVELEGLGLQQMKHEDAALRELIGSRHIDDLKVFASAMEPVSFGERYEQQKTSQNTVLDRFVDAVVPDPPSRYAFERLTASFLKAPNAKDAEELRTMYAELIKAAPGAQRTIESSPLLMDVRDRVKEMPALAQAGVDALGFVSAGTKAPAGWKAEKLALIADAKKPSGIVRFTFLDSLETLVMAVQE